MGNKNFFQELAEYRVRVERNGKEIVNVPGLLCLPGLLAVPRLTIAGMVAAPLLGFNIHLANESGRDVDIEGTMRKAAETVIDTASNAARTVKDEFEKAWQAVSADDPEEETETGETEAEPGQEPAEKPQTEGTEAAPEQDAGEEPDQTEE